MRENVKGGGSLKYILVQNALQIRNECLEHVDNQQLTRKFLNELKYTSGFIRLIHSRCVDKTNNIEEFFL